MGAWGYVFLAYGIVWSAIVLYLLCLKRRLRLAETEAAQLRSVEGVQGHAQK